MSAVPKIQPVPPVDQLHRTPASDVKKLGWRGVMRQLQTQGPVLVTNHQQPEAVILPVQAYAALLARAQHAADPAFENESPRSRAPLWLAVGVLLGLAVPGVAYWMGRGGAPAPMPPTPRPMAEASLPMPSSSPAEASSPTPSSSALSCTPCARPWMPWGRVCAGGSHRNALWRPRWHTPCAPRWPGWMPSWPPPR